jgi:EamA domain-containing membrane protein RarD
LVAGAVTFYYVRENTTSQIFVSIVTSVAYVFWGLIHHMIKKDLQKKIVIEYMLIGLIAMIVLIVLIRS